MEGRVSAANRFKVRTAQQTGEGSHEADPTPKQTGTLSTVIGSLDKLVELEKRISSLESDNVHGRVQGGATVPQRKLAPLRRGACSLVTQAAFLLNVTKIGGGAYSAFETD